MALTRKMLKAMGIEEDKIEQIIDAHTETTEALKTERNGYKEKAEKLESVQEELNELKSAGKDDWEAKYDSVKKEFDDYKKAQADKETLASKKTAYKKLVMGTGIKGEKLINLILNSVNFDEVELDGETIKEAEKLTETIKTEYAEYIPTQGTEGATVENPPKGGSVDLGTLDMASYIEARKKQ